ncbi:unnamed protein product [Toxocara canis]|uniref:DUF4365 domain-containing protein n=1 Tax=Toxocara canis TaxID=6265 RepID=A0A183V693_TOXCA|nr:unnamed protein product [Toxocara canis]
MIKYVEDGAQCQERCQTDSRLSLSRIASADDAYVERPVSYACLLVILVDLPYVLPLRSYNSFGHWYMPNLNEFTRKELVISAQRHIGSSRLE